MSIQPLIAICGTTGVGKSKLAVELALSLAARTHRQGWHGARIINADSMQVYAGMDIITNKLPESERKGVEHLLLGFKEPGDQYVVGQWVGDAVQQIEETHQRGQVPVVVGGTAYWMQNLLFPRRLVSSPGSESTSKRVEYAPELLQSLAELPSSLLDLFDALPDPPPSAAFDPDGAFELHRLLLELDPAIGRRWHWKDTRKVLRHLEIIKETGRRASDILSEQAQLALSPRYKTLVLWLYSDPIKLNPQLDSRVDAMIEQGLLEEIRQLKAIVSDVAVPDTMLYERASEDSGPENETDYTLGIYQAIGYKEFHEYLETPTPSPPLFDKAVEHMKASTRKYAKRQVTWIRNKLLPAICESQAAACEGKTVSMYRLDASEHDKWQEKVCDAALRLMDGFLSNEELPDAFAVSPEAATMLNPFGKVVSPTALLASHQKRVCPVCTMDEERPVMLEEGAEWAAHQRSRSHRRLAGKDEKRLREEEGRAAKRAERARKREGLGGAAVVSDGAGSTF